MPKWLNDQNNFIHGQMIDRDLAVSLIDQFHKNEEHHIDKSNEYFGYVVLADCFSIIDQKIKGQYVDQLHACILGYIEKYKFAGEKKNYFSVDPKCNIQMYKPGNHYSEWHCENSGYLPNVTRHLAFMTYLNDVQEGGETEFLYQNIKIKPQQGLTVIWPTSWPFTHRGLPSMTQTKYIITGWLTFTTWMGVSLEFN